MARSLVEQVGTRAAFDRLDAALSAIGALSDTDVLAARQALGINVGCLVESYEIRRVTTISARTFPVTRVDAARAAQPEETSADAG